MCLLGVGGQGEENTQITVGSCLCLSTVARAQVFRLSRRYLYQLSCLRMPFLTVSPPLHSYRFFLFCISCICLFLSFLVLAPRSSFHYLRGTPTPADQPGHSFHLPRSSLPLPILYPVAIVTLKRTQSSSPSCRYFKSLRSSPFSLEQ